VGYPGSAARVVVDPAGGRDEARPGGRESVPDVVCFGERAALYLSTAIHIASDVAQHDFGPAASRESAFLKSALPEGGLRENQATLDASMNARTATTWSASTS
jgi:hypothetical protein